MARMTAYWQVILAAFLGFVASCVVQWIVMHWKERVESKLLRKSLYRELATIYIDLRELLPLLQIKGPIEHERNPANLPDFVKAECFNAARSLPLFWRLSDAVGIVQAHRQFGFLAISRKKDHSSSALAIRTVLRGFQESFDNQKLSRRILLEVAGGQIVETELSLNVGSQKLRLLDRLRSRKTRQR